MKVVFYCRVANADRLALAAQEAQLREYAISREYEIGAIVKEFCPGLTLDRPGIHRLISFAENHSMDGILTTDYSRISRSFTDLLIFDQGLRKHGIDCRIANKNEAFGNLPSISDLWDKDNLTLAFRRYLERGKHGGEKRGR